MLTYYKLKCCKEYLIETKVTTERCVYKNKCIRFAVFFAVGLCTIHFKNESDQS